MRSSTSFPNDFKPERNILRRCPNAIETVRDKSFASAGKRGSSNRSKCTTAEVTFGGTTYQTLLAYDAAREKMDEARDFLEARLKAGAEKITTKIKVFPTGTLRFGWAFDFW